MRVATQRKDGGMRAEDDEARGVTVPTPVTALHWEDVPATSEQLPPLRHALAEWATAIGLPNDQVDAVTLAADEAMSNVVSHAYPDGPGTLDLSAVHHAEPAGVLVTVRDHGRWLPVREDPGPLHGRGLLLIRALAHEVAIEQSADGTTVRMNWSTDGGSRH
jgi:anti-sigma regulatory factor (Ser/Thr protein kinase)